MTISVNIIGYEKTFKLECSLRTDVIKYLKDIFEVFGLEKEEIDIIKFYNDTDEINELIIYELKMIYNIYIHINDTQIRNKIIYGINNENDDDSDSDSDNEDDDDNEFYINMGKNTNEKHKYNYYSDNDCDFITNSTVFEMSGTDNLQFNSVLNEPLTQYEEEEDIITDDIIIQQNKKTIELIGNPDFIKLLEIYNTKPDLLKMFLLFIQNGDIIEQDIEYDINEKDKYINEINEISRLNIAPYQDIVKYIIYHKGHINLTIRSLLNKN